MEWSEKVLNGVDVDIACVMAQSGLTGDVQAELVRLLGEETEKIVKKLEINALRWDNTNLEKL